MTLNPFNVLLCLFCAVGNIAASNSSRPNILILFADDLGWGDLGSYGHPTASTPNIDKLASTGIRFTQWYSGSHVCSPSRSSMMTGRLPARIGMAGANMYGGVLGPSSVGGLPKNETSMAELMKRGGYRTKAIGKWHLGYTDEHLPTGHGFDEYFGVPYSVDMGNSAWRPALDNAANPPLPLIKATKKNNPDGGFTILEQPVDLNLLTEKYVKETTSFIGEGDGDGEPWFIYLPFNHVHVPDFVSEKFCGTTLRGTFGDALAEMDWAVGEIYKHLEVTGQLENTVIFFTSDNGPWLLEKIAGGSAGHLRDGKGTTWEGGVRVPGIISGLKGQLSDVPRTDRTVVATYDIFATAAKLAGVNLPDDRVIDGVDLTPLMFAGDENFTPHECIFHYKGSPWETDCGYDKCEGLWAVRCGGYKAHFVTNNSTFDGKGAFQDAVFHDPPLIYAINRDPGENFVLTQGTGEWNSAYDTITSAVTEHMKNFTQVPNQALLGTDYDLMPCCNGINKQTASCVCNEENFDVFVCNMKEEESGFSEDLYIREETNTSPDDYNPSSCVNLESVSSF